MKQPEISGWIEYQGTRLSPDAVASICQDRPQEIIRFGGEFWLRWDNCSARDCLGIINGNGPKGSLVCGDTIRAEIRPDVPDLPLDEAIVAAVALRSDEGIMALSGGVDSALVAQLAGRECISVGMENSHDLKQARHAADVLGLSCTFIAITEDEIEAALPTVVAAIPAKDPVSTGIALTQYFITQWAGNHGYHRIITGQGADELFGGYARYSLSENLEADLAKDFLGLEAQARRDQTVAGLHRTYLSMPYLDLRVVRAAQKIPAREKVQGDRRKIALRKVAERYIPQDLAWYEKKAMQYGSGVWGTMRRLARKNGYKTSMQDYIDQIIRVEHGH